MTFGIMSWSLLAAAGLAIVCGGDLRQIATVRIRGWWLLGLALLLKIGLWLGHAPSLPWEQPLIFALVALGVGANWRLPGVLLVAAGLLLNVLVVTANGGFMPFSVQAYVAAGKSLDPETGAPKSSAVSHPEAAVTPFLWLDDRIPFPPSHQVISVGDISIMAGGVWLVVRIAQPTRLWKLGAWLRVLPSTLAES